MGSDGYTLVELLLFEIYDKLASISWQLGGKGRRPKPISPQAKKRQKRVGKTDRSRGEVEALLHRIGPPRAA